MNSRTASPVRPVTSTISGIASTFTRTFPANSLSVIRIGAGTPLDTEDPVVTVTASPATPDGTGGWYTSAVSLSATATDDTRRGARPSR